MSPIQNDPNHQFNSFADTTIEQAQNNTFFAVQAQVKNVNAAKAADYDVQFQSYAKQKSERPDATDIFAPVPEFAEVVIIDGGGWPLVTVGLDRVCPFKIWTPAKVTPSVSIFGTGTQTTPDPFQVALYTTVDHAGMKFLRVA